MVNKTTMKISVHPYFAVKVVAKHVNRSLSVITKLFQVLETIGSPCGKQLTMDFNW